MNKTTLHSLSLLSLNIELQKKENERALKVITRHESGLSHPGDLGHALSRSSGSYPAYENIPNSELDHMY